MRSCYKEQVDIDYGEKKYLNQEIVQVRVDY